MKVRIQWPIAVQVGGLDTNYHGPNGEVVRQGWRRYNLPRGYRFYRYFKSGVSLCWDFQLRREWWKIIRWF